MQVYALNLTSYSFAAICRMDFRSALIMPMVLEWIPSTE